MRCLMNYSKLFFKIRQVYLQFVLYDELFNTSNQTLSPKLLCDELFNTSDRALSPKRSAINDTKEEYKTKYFIKTNGSVTYYLTFGINNIKKLYGKYFTSKNFIYSEYTINITAFIIKPRTHMTPAPR